MIRNTIISLAIHSNQQIQIRNFLNSIKNNNKKALFSNFIPRTIFYLLFNRVFWVNKRNCYQQD